MWWAGPEHSSEAGAAQAKLAPTWWGVAEPSDAGSLRGWQGLLCWRMTCGV